MSGQWDPLEVVIGSYQYHRQSDFPQGLAEVEGKVSQAKSGLELGCLEPFTFNSLCESACCTTNQQNGVGSFGLGTL